MSEDMILGLNHFTIAVKDLDVSFSFYKDVLGLRPLMKHEKGAYFLAGDSWFCLDLDPSTRTEPLAEYTHIAFGVLPEDFRAVAEKVLSHGAEIWKENRSEGQSIYFLDPNGHKLEIHVGNWRTRISSLIENPWNKTVQIFTDKAESLHLELVPEVLAIARLNSDGPIPEWALRSSFFSITKTSEELSVVCEQDYLPQEVRGERDWRALKVKGPLEFSLTGVLASVSGPLATSGVSLFAISTFDTDYILVKQDKVSRAVSALKNAGHILFFER